jgi:hypothetical protein
VYRHVHIVGTTYAYNPYIVQHTSTSRRGAATYGGRSTACNLTDPAGGTTLDSYIDLCQVLDNLPRYAWFLDTEIDCGAAPQSIPVLKNHSGADYLLLHFGGSRCLQAGPIQI